MPRIALSPARENLLSKASLASGRRIGYFLAAVGVVLLCWGEFLFCRERLYLAHARHSTARVVAVQESHSRFGVQYSPVFAYADATGKQWQIVSVKSANTPADAMSQNADVVYPPDNPGQGQVEDFFTRWGVALVLGGAGAVLASVGYIGTGVFEWLERTTHLR